MKVAIIGLGSIGSRHARNLRALGHDVAGYNRGAERREEAATVMSIPVFPSIEEILTGWRPDAVVVCTPQHMHVRHARAAIDRGLHVFVEKPVSDTFDGLDDLIADASAKGLVTHVGCNMRYHFGPAWLKKTLDKGLLGRPLWARINAGMHLPDWHPDEDYRQLYSAKQSMGGGAVMDFIHELDLSLWLFGQPVEVVGMVSKSGWLEIETEDVVDSLLRYPNGLQVNLHADYLQKPFQRGIRIVGDRGWAEWDLANEHICHYDYEEKKAIVYNYPDGYEHNDMYVDQMRHFLNAIEFGEDPDYGLTAGRLALQLAIRLKHSSENRQFQ